MTHPPDQIVRALELQDKGLTATEAARVLDIPRPTVRDWFAGELPEVATRAGESCRRCGGAAHGFDELDATYVYLLGLYLGDGCVSPHHRGVFKLRIFLEACDRLGLRYTTCPNTVYVSRKADVAVLDRHIGPKT